MALRHLPQTRIFRMECGVDSQTSDRKRESGSMNNSFENGRKSNGARDEI